MFDFELVHRPALGAATAISSERIKLTPLPEGTVLQLFGSDPAALAAFANERGVSLRANGPGQWYLVGDKSQLAVALSELPGGFTVIDQSHGRVRITVEGPAARAVLAKGSGLDLATLATGDATTALFGHIAAHITCSGPNNYELMPIRGFANNLWRDLEAMAAEFIHKPSD